ncbi:hypothetical protein BKA67DRAFT_675061 [Truncatella angustata]|uniref:Uncharacterized protein n=1 Tax=Truncatella angustata TaxID=152316 RepID=A0A9P8ZZH7_9PEZI|nr:uncharacterized protein BKA67DRAFT_675061 [Truncatella angustata]KAH6655029.1 hypothetical protein BKA67DRAFT_675061 [Truncatella angustata]KAH8196100.1 hypothetical protein TruAng_009727 [Truncatella angustata]
MSNNFLKLLAAEEKIRSLKSKLKVSQKADWVKENSALEARVRGLEDENDLLWERLSKRKKKVNRSKNVNCFDSSTSHDKQGAIATEILPKFTLEAAEKRYSELEAQLEAKQHQCDELSTELAVMSNSRYFLHCSVDDAEVCHQWRMLQMAIDQLCHSHFDQPVRQKVQDKMALKELVALSSDSQSYLIGAQRCSPSTLFQAAIWRHLQHRFFERPWRCLGEDIHRKSKVFSAKLQDKDPSEAYSAWRLFTARLLDGSLQINDKTIATQTEKIYAALAKYANPIHEVESREIKEKLQSVVRSAARLCSVFATTTAYPLMSNQPGNSDTHGFWFDVDTMIRHSRYSSDSTDTIVDMMITPILIRRGERGGVQLLGKARVTTSSAAW